MGTANQALTTTYTYTLYSDGIVEKLVVTQPSPSGTDHTAYAYDTHGNLTSVTDGLGHATTYSNYNGLGEVGKIVGPNGDEMDYTYDARGRVATKTTHPNGGTATWTYAYDGFGLLTKVSAPDGEITTWNRDAEKRIKTSTHNDKDGTSTESFSYDANGDVISDVIARGSDVGKKTTYVYNALGKIYQVKGSHGQVLTYAYDGYGNVLSVTDALGHKTSYAYDALNRMVGVTNAATGITSYAYDAGDNVIAVEDPRGLVTEYTWDGLGQLWQQQSPDTGTTTFSYDGYGRLATKTPADGIKVSYAYDALNRLTSEVAGGVTRIYTWDVCANGKERFCAANTQGYSNVSYAYSPEGWITARAFLIAGSPSYTIGYGYDNMGHLTAVDYPDGNEAMYDYMDGAVADVRLKDGGNTLYGVTGITYRPMDLAMSGWATWDSSPSDTITYDSDLRPTSITASGIESLAFTYDAANRITRITNGMDATLSQTLGYDALNRLTSESASAENESYQYDADGNRTYQVINGMPTSFTYPSGSNRLENSAEPGALPTSYGYNADGNTTTVKGLTAYTYGPFGGLVSADGASFDISAEGQRLRKSMGGNTTYLATDANGTLQAEDDNGNWMDYVWLNGRLVITIVNYGVFPVHGDQTGRPMYVSHPYSHDVIWAVQDLPFTRNIATNTFWTFNLGFPGQYYDSESGLWHNGYRDYDASLGRYIESDPTGLAGGINTYAYVGDSPITRIDPLGLCDQQKCAQASSVVAALGQALSSTGSGLTWTGVGITAASVLGGVFAPEGAELEVEGGVEGVSLIRAGTGLSELGSAVTGYARNGVLGALEYGSAAFMLGKLEEGIAGLSLPEGTSEATTKAVEGVFGELGEAIQAEQAACVGH